MKVDRKARFKYFFCITALFTLILGGSKLMLDKAIGSIEVQTVEKQ